jgi:hypothetical protein
MEEIVRKILNISRSVNDFHNLARQLAKKYRYLRSRPFAFSICGKAWTVKKAVDFHLDFAQIAA